MEFEGIDDVEKSDSMNEHYNKSTDPWHNRERKLYQVVLKKAMIDSINFTNKSKIMYYDMGAGGGNVIDTAIENTPDNIKLQVGGCDISQFAIDYLKKQYDDPSGFDCMDLEDYLYKDNPVPHFSKADLISFIDVMYYFDTKRYYKITLDEIWKAIKPGAVVLVADSIIPYQRRSYFKTKEDSELLEEFTEYASPVGRLNNSNKNRYLKVKIYRKLTDSSIQK